MVGPAQPIDRLPRHVVREVALADFFLGPARTVLKQELVVEMSFQVPDSPSARITRTIAKPRVEVNNACAMCAAVHTPMATK